jgi:hypothetical protein
MTLYLKLGGRPAIEEAAKRLQRRLRHDPAFREPVASAPDNHRTDLSEFLIFLSGGSPFYDGTPIGKILAPLCPSDEAFDLFVDHLATVLIGNDRPVQVEAQLRLLMEHIRPYAVDSEVSPQMKENAVA